MADTASQLSSLAERTGFPPDAVRAAFDALRSGRGQAQFSHPALGGMGQWSPGMVMIGDMFNADLKSRVDGLFRDLARLSEGKASDDAAPAAGTPSLSGSDGWWPSELGRPASAGSQNDLRYAVFPDRQRVAVWSDGAVVVYDTGGRRITGAGQQQSGASSFTLTGPDGPIPIDSLKRVDAR